MRPLKLFVAVSLDQFIARSDGRVDWLFTDQDYGYQEFYQSIDTLLMGRKTYDQVLTFGEYPYPEKKSYIFTRNPALKAKAPIEFVSSDSSEFIKNLKQKSGKDIWLVGGGELTRYCFQHHLIDELILSIHPILLGEGIPLFSGLPQDIPLQFVAVKNFSTGLVQAHYQIQLSVS